MKLDGDLFDALFAGVNANCMQYRLTAINPFTMFRSNFDGYACALPYNVRNVNFKLADKDTIPPDRTAPVINVNLKVADDQVPDNRIVAGTTLGFARALVVHPGYLGDTVFLGPAVRALKRRWPEGEGPCHRAPQN